MGISAFDLNGQIETNDFEVDILSQKLKYQRAILSGEKKNALAHLEIIRNEYQGTNLWDSVLVYNHRISDLALILGELEIHLNAYMTNMEIEDMFNAKRKTGWSEKIAYIDKFKEDPGLNHFRKWSIYDKLSLFAYENNLVDSTLFLLDKTIYHSDLSSQKPISIASRRKAAIFLNGFGKHHQALVHLKWIESSKKFSLEKPFLQSQIYDAMGLAFKEINDYEKAQYYFEKVVNICAKNGYQRGLADGYNFLGQLLIFREEPVQARENFIRAIPICKQKKMTFEQAECYVYTAASYKMEGDYESANQYLDSAFSLLPVVDSSMLDFIYYREKIETDLSLGNIDDATVCFEKLKKIHVSQKNVPTIVNTLGYKVSKAQGESKVALKYLEASHRIQDSIRKLNDLELTQRLESEFNRNVQNEKILNLDLERVEQGKKLNRRNRILVFGLIFLLIVSGLLFFLTKLYGKNKKNNKLLAEQNVVINKALGKNKLLLKEIHHRVKNNLQVISSLLSLQERKVDDEQTKEALKSSKTRVETMSILHQSLYQNDEYRLINAPQYFDKLINNLVDTYSLRQDLKVTKVIDDLQFDIESLIPIGLVANELICNAIKHGVGDKPNGEIEISLIARDGAIVLSVSDNGGGINENFLIEDKDSLGVKLIKAFSNRLDAELIVENGSQSKVSIIMEKSVLQST